MTIRNLRQFKRNGEISLLDVMSVDDVMEIRPCAFDTVSKLTLEDDTFSEYDSEQDVE